MRSILVVNPKSGCGKTTIATNLAGYYAHKDISVLLVDLDQHRSSFQ
ncbi:MAG: chromosome partitioning protein [Arenicella sp.]|jgi:chromosome partitioning protein